MCKAQNSCTSGSGWSQSIATATNDWLSRALTASLGMAPSTRARHAPQKPARPSSMNTFLRSPRAAARPSAREVYHLTAPRSLKWGWAPGVFGIVRLLLSHATRVSPAAARALVVAVNPLHLDEIGLSLIHISEPTRLG